MSAGLMKPFSQACENNKHPIRSVLRREFIGVRAVLEIGSGTGQHAAYFAQHLNHLSWQPSDLEENLAGINTWVDDADLANLRQALALDVAWASWPVPAADAIFSANTLHIMCWSRVERMFAGIGRTLSPGGVCAVYGPFNYAGVYTSESNGRFDSWLRQRDPASGLRNFEDVDALAREAGLALETDNAMPANNRLIIWRKRTQQPA